VWLIRWVGGSRAEGTGGGLTVLDELEAVGDVARVGCEEETALLLRFARGGFRFGDFGPELDAPTDDAAIFRWDRWRWGMRVFEVGSGVGLADVGCEWAASLGLLVVGEDVAEVVVLESVFAEVVVVPDWSEIDRCACVAVW